MTYTVLLKLMTHYTARLQNKSRMTKVSLVHRLIHNSNQQVAAQPINAKWWKVLIIQISPGPVPADCTHQQQQLQCAGKPSTALDVTCIASTTARRRVKYSQTDSPYILLSVTQVKWSISTSCSRCLGNLHRC